MNIKIFLLYFFIIQFFLFKIKANNIILLNADYAIHNKNDMILILKGNIIFQHKNYKIKCDYVKYYKIINKFIGEGHVNIIYSNNKIKLYSKYIEYDINKNIYKIYGNPIIYTKNSKLTGNIIIYNDNIKLFKLFGNSSFINKKIQLKSDKIEYNYINYTVYYNNGGNIYLNNNIFFSENGIYIISYEKIIFNKIYLTNQKNTFISNKIIYYINSNKIQFLGPTLIIKNNKIKNFIYTKDGIHYINESITLLKNNYHGLISFNNYIIKSNNIFFNHKNNNVYLKNNINLELINKKQYFNAGYGEITNKLFILKDNPILINILNKSKIFFSSDTLINKNLLYAYNSNTELDNIYISSNYMIYNKNIIEYHNNSQIFFNKKNKIIGNIISLIIDNKKNINLIKIQNNTLFINKIYKLGILKFNKILGSLINIFIINNKIKKIIINKRIKILSYNFYKKLKNKKIFTNVDIINSDKLILYINNLLTKIFFIGNAKSISLNKEIIDNKKLLFFINFCKKKNHTINDLQKIIIYINLKKDIKKYIEDIKKNF